jgi:creatinine amidohydrolase
MKDAMGRRRFMGATAAGALLSVTPKSMGISTEEAGEHEVRLEYMRPRQIDAIQKQCATVFQPLGTIEWHGLHSVVGVDALKAHALCVRAARKGGGLVCPPLYGGVGGLKQPHTFVMDEEDNIFANLTRPWIEQLCREMARDGFKAIIMLTGHYGAAQQIVVRETAVRMSRSLSIPVLGIPEYWLGLDVGYTGDHAAWGETSLMMHLYPGSVNLSELGDPPYQGVGGRDPKESSEADGKLLADTIVSRLARLAESMPTWDHATLDRFVEAEAMLVARQISAPRGKGNLWTAWRNVASAMKDYGKHLVGGEFERIQEAAAKL